MLVVQLASLCLSLATALGAQSPCTDLTVPNGGFDPGSPDPWVLQTAGMQSSLVFATDGINASECVELRGTTEGGTMTLRQVATVPLQAGVDYELSIDAFSAPESGEPSLSANLNFILQGDGVATSAIAGLLQNGYRRVSARLTVLATDDYQINLLVQSSLDLRATYRFDDLRIRVAGPLRIGLPAERSAGSTNTVEVRGPANSPVAALISLRATTTPGVAITGCSGELSLGAPLFVLGSIGTTNAGGAVQLPLFVPAGAAGIEFTWQPIGLSPCAFGCPIVLGFP